MNDGSGAPGSGDGGTEPLRLERNETVNERPSAVPRRLHDTRGIRHEPVASMNVSSLPQRRRSSWQRPLSLCTRLQAREPR